MRDIDWVEVLARVFFGSFALILACGVLFGGLEIVQSIRAREATFACESRNLQAVRMTFSTKVACIPRTFGADTVNLKTVQ